MPVAQILRFGSVNGDDMNDIWFSFGTNRSAGVPILKGNFKAHILSHEADNTGRWIILLVDVNHVQFIVVNT